jgi:O-antigen/teichoic acid export membrane protein
MTDTTVVVTRRRLTLATGVQIGGRVLGAFLGVLVAASLARSLSRPEFGQLSLALTILALAGSLADLGINQIAVREMARRPEARASIAGSLWVTQLTMGIVLGVIGTGVAFVLMSGAQPRIMAALVMATLPVGAVGAFTIAAQARLRPELVIVPALVQNVVWLAVVLTLAAVHGGIALYGVGCLSAGAVQSIVTLALAARITKVSFGGTRRTIAGLLRLAWPIGLAGMFVTAYYRIDSILLFHYRGATAAAYYSAAYRVIDVLQILPMTVSGVLLPLLASAERESAAATRLRQLLELSIAMLLAVAVPIAVCGGILAPAIVVLIYGHHYHSSIYLLQVLLPAFIPICLGYILTGQLILHGMLRPYIVITFVGAVLNVIANAVAIPRYGAAAAAWATLGTELVVMAAIAGVVGRRLGVRFPINRVLRLLVAVAVTAAALWPVRSQSLVLSMAVAGVVYIPAMLALKVVSIPEIRALLTRQAAANA